ncbi:MAG: TonB-dependent receptor [Bacteroidota bacterium]
MKKLFILLMFFSGLGFATAQNLLKGKVTDQSGQALPGVTVMERGTSNGAATDASGMYSIRFSGKPDAVIVFTYIGYATKEVSAGKGTTLDVTMQSDEALLGQVVVVGSRRQNRVQTETPVPVDVINVGQVSPTTSRVDLTSLLNFAAPSFNYNKQSGSDGADHIDLATLRGLGPDQTLVLINGKRRHQTAFVAVFGTRGRGNAGTDLNAIPALAIDRVEILRDGASAQYGSDAIAGVINIILKKNIDHVSADLGYSGYYDKKYNPAFKTETGQYVHEKKTDGQTYTAAVNFGRPIGEKGGFYNLNFNYSDVNKTYRQELDGKLPTNNVRRANGDGSMKGYGAMFNMEAPIKANNRLTFYAFGGANQKFSDAYAFSRNFSGKPQRFPTDKDRNLIPVPGIILETKPDASGFVEQYYNPHIQTHIQDISFAAGLKGQTAGGWDWDLSNITGDNNFHFYGDKTFNPGLGIGQTHFDDGGFRFRQNTTNLNFSKLYDKVLSGFNLAFGAEYRTENYKLFAGEEASYARYGNPIFRVDSLFDGGTFTGLDTIYRPSGSQGFPGYQPSDEVNAKRSCAGAYADVELDVTDKFLIGAALRFENYSDFGSTFNYKLAARYKLLKNFNLRGSYSTGFRAPSLQQINFSSTFTTVQGGKISEVKIAPNASPITKAAGIPALKQELSQNASIGFTCKPMKELTITVDAYQVKIKDRVVLSGQFDATDASLNPAFTDRLKALNVGLAQFFANAVNTTNKGLDFVLDYNRKLPNGHCRLLLTGNFQKMTIDKINVPRLLDDTPEHRANFLSDREQTFILASAPPVKIGANLEWGIKKLTAGIRLSYFGKVTLLGYGEDGLGINPMVPTDADPTKYVADKYVYGARLVPDVYAAWSFTSHISLNIGVDNFLNLHPNLGYVAAASGWAFNNEPGGPWDAVQMGGNGMRLFARLALNF